MDNNNSQGPYTYYQNLYNMFGSVNPIVDKNVKELRRLGALCGIAVLGFSFLQYAFIFILNAVGLYDEYRTDMVFQHGLGAIAPILYVFLPFFIIYLFYKPEEKEQVVAFRKPKSVEMFVLAIVAGLMVCFVGDIATSFFSGIVSAFGVDFSSPDVELPGDTLGKILLVIESAVVPALVEEFALRGVILAPLRKYGDWFAIVITSIIFALMHGNMIQIPFAFIAGLAFGYFRITTGTLWTPVIIHSLNNLSSVIFSLYYTNHEDAGYLQFFVINSAVIVAGTFALILFLKNKGVKLKKDPTATGRSLKMAAYMCSPTVILGITVAVYSTLIFTKVTAGFGFLVLLAMIALIGFFIIRGITVLKKDKRINHTPMDNVSMAVTIISLFVEVYLVMAISFSTAFNY